MRRKEPANQEYSQRNSKGVCESLEGSQLMKQLTEQDRIAARALAKNLIKQFEGIGLQRTGNSQDLIERACSLLRREAVNNGISPKVLKWYVSAVRTGEI